MSNINSGMLAVSLTPEKPKTILVIGYERSGTSMVAGALSRLGVFVGDSFQDPVFEDERLGMALKKNRGYGAVIDDYNARYNQWHSRSRPAINRF